MYVVQNREIQNMMLRSISVYRYTFFVLDKFDVRVIGRNYRIVYLYTQTSQIDFFSVSIGFCDGSGPQAVKACAE